MQLLKKHSIATSLTEKHILFVGASPEEIASPKKMRLQLMESQPVYDYIVAVDGGANWCRKYHVKIDAFIGDGDTLNKGTMRWIRRAASEIILCNPHKDDTDFSLALKTFLARYSTHPCAVDCIGVLGGKLEHLLGVLGVLQRACPLYPNVRFSLRGVSQTVLILSHPGSGCVAIVKEHLANVGDDFSVVPLTRCLISESGCEWNLQRKMLLPLADRGISNRVKTKDARISVQKGVALALFSHE